MPVTRRLLIYRAAVKKNSVVRCEQKLIERSLTHRISPSPEEGFCADQASQWLNMNSVELSSAHTRSS
jgi:hypothetical protein